jgi:hypothetical protein
MWTRRRPIEQDYAAAKDAEGEKIEDEKMRRWGAFGCWRFEVGGKKLSEKIEVEKLRRWEAMEVGIRN